MNVLSRPSLIKKSSGSRTCVLYNVPELVPYLDGLAWQRALQVPSTHACTYTPTQPTHPPTNPLTHLRARTHVRTHTRTHVRTHARTQTHTHARMHTRTHERTHRCTHDARKHAHHSQKKNRKRGSITSYCTRGKCHIFFLMLLFCSNIR